MFKKIVGKIKAIPINSWTETKCKGNTAGRYIPEEEAGIYAFKAKCGEYAYLVQRTVRRYDRAFLDGNDDWYSKYLLQVRDSSDICVFEETGESVGTIYDLITKKKCAEEKKKTKLAKENFQKDLEERVE